MNEPTLRVVFFLQVLFVLSYLVVPLPFFFTFLAINVLLLLLSSPKFRKYLSALVRLIFIWAFFLSVVGAGRVIGGLSAETVLAESALRFEFFLLILFLATLAYLYIKPQDYLRIFDKARIPREGSYIFLSVITLIDYVRDTGQRQLRLLTIKGLGPEGLGKRVRAYYRILGPLFSVLLSRQVVHSRSLFYRGFFSGRPIKDAGHTRLQREEIWWLALSFVNFISCLLASRWISR